MRYVRFVGIMLLSFLLLGCPIMVTPTNVLTPTFNPAAGTYTADQVVSISTATAGATIYYTTDGETPTENSNLYTAPIAIAGDNTSVTIKAVAIKTGMNSSEIATAHYTIDYPEQIIIEPKVVAGGEHTLVLKTDGKLLAMGGNYSGQLGDGTNIARTSPVEVMSGVKTIAAGFEHTMILKTDGTLWATGANGHGQLCDGTTTDRNLPYQVMSDVKAVSAGQAHTMVLKSDGTLWASGWNYNGQLGDGTTVDRSTAVQVMNNVQAVSAGYYHTMILKTDGTLWAVGGNEYGQLGDGTLIDRSEPVSVMSGVKDVAAGNTHTMILKTDGTLWATGSNLDGQLGDSTLSQFEYQKTPVEVMSGVMAVAVGYYHTAILKSDGTLWTTGSNVYGQLGDGSVSIAQRDPVQVMDNVKSVSAGSEHTMILKNDNTLWGTGSNDYGQLGDGTKVDRNPPVQISF